MLLSSHLTHNHVSGGDDALNSEFLGAATIATHDVTSDTTHFTVQCQQSDPRSRVPARLAKPQHPQSEEDNLGEI